MKRETKKWPDVVHVNGQPFHRTNKTGRDIKTNEPCAEYARHYKIGGQSYEDRVWYYTDGRTERD